MTPTIKAYQISHQSLTRMSFSKVITHKRICIGTMNYHQTTTPAPTCKPACVPKHNSGPLLNGDLGNLIEMDNSESTTGTDIHCRLLNQCQVDEQHTQHLTEKKNAKKPPPPKKKLSLPCQISNLHLRQYQTVCFLLSSSCRENFLKDLKPFLKLNFTVIKTLN